LGNEIKRTFIGKWNTCYYAKKRINEYKKIPRILVCSSYIRNEYLKNGFSEDQVAVNYPYPDIPPVEKIAYPQSGKMILFAGRVNRYKGLDFLLKVLAIARSDLSLVVAGSGAWVEKMKKLAEKIGVKKRVEFKGWCKTKEIEELYAKCSVVAIPSVWPEPLSLVGLEGSSYGRPVVAFNVGGIPDWLRDGQNGFLVPPGDIRRLAECIEKLISDRELAENMGKKGREIIESEFSKEKYYGKLYKNFQFVIDSKK
jgi:glycosyltransferase involved in cell wall biosynthesis